MEDNIIMFRKLKLFKNGVLVDLDKGTAIMADILVENKKIVAIEPWGSIEKNYQLNENNCQKIDLKGDFVVKPFVNTFCNSSKAVENSYGLELKNVDKLLSACETHEGEEKIVEEDLKVFFSSLISTKSTLSGACFDNNVWALTHRKIKNITDNKLYLEYVENIDKLSETELDEICLRVNQNKGRLIIKVGQTLDELGAIDKMYKKPVSQVLEDFGLLDRKPIIVGGNCLEKDELELLRNYDCSFVVTPYDDARNGRRPTNLITLKSFGFDVGIGSGESAEIDFFAYMRQILMNMRAMFEDKNIISEQEVLLMATNSNPSICLGEVGDIKVGETASFMVVRSEPTLYNDIFKILVWEKSKKDVVMTVINGEILQKNGEILMKNWLSCDTIKNRIKLITKYKSDND